MPFELNKIKVKEVNTYYNKFLAECPMHSTFDTNNGLVVDAIAYALEAAHVNDNSMVIDDNGGLFVKILYRKEFIRQEFAKAIETYIFGAFADGSNVEKAIEIIDRAYHNKNLGVISPTTSLISERFFKNDLRFLIKQVEGQNYTEFKYKDVNDIQSIYKQLKDIVLNK